MTIDEAIKHCLEVAEHNEALIKRGYAGGCNSHDCSERAENHRQLAEWLKELKRWKENPFEVIDDSYCSKVDDCVECDFVNCCPNRGVRRAENA